ncbi:MAG: RnfABCDGE type electron transport complex subunit G [Prevotella sp.]|nr:RnfABCDGE type electron transport complex subunit G [Prevotella sp.]
MKKLESTLTNMVVVLTAVAVVMGGVLAWVNHLTSGPINEQKQQALQNGIKAVMQADGELAVTATDTIRQTDAKGKDQTFIVYHTEKGAAVESTTLGFGGNLKVLVGFDAEGRILGYTLLEHQETPGLGAKADQWFQKGQKGDIIGRNPAEGLTVTKDGGQVDAITASTITSRAFLLAVTNAYNAYQGKAADGATGASKSNKK